MARRKPTALDDLDALVDAIIVDANGDDEQQTAFLEVFTQDVPRVGCQKSTHALTRPLAGCVQKWD